MVPPGVLLGDDRHHVGVGGVTGHRHDDEPVADVVVEVRDRDASAADLGERQDRHLDDLERSAAGVDGAGSPAAVDVAAQPVGLGLVGAALQHEDARSGEGRHVVDVAVGVVVEGQPVGQPHDDVDAELVDQVLLDLAPRSGRGCGWGAAGTASS